MNVCEHGDHPAPEGKRFCSLECADCEHGVRDCQWCKWEKNQPDLGLALSVHAPWAWAFFYAGKDVENRAKSFPHRRDGRELLGRVWVHASMWPGPTPVSIWNDMRYPMVAKWLNKCGEVGAHRTLQLGDKDSMFALRGHIVGSVEVYGYAGSSDSPWYVPGSLAILVRNPRPIATPVRAKGALGWWRPEESVLAACREAA